jgi:hypothetical protein
MEQKDISYLLFGAILFLGWQMFKLNQKVDELAMGAYLPDEIREVVETCRVNDDEIECRKTGIHPNLWWHK